MSAEPKHPWEVIVGDYAPIDPALVSALSRGQSHVLITEGVLDAIHFAERVAQSEASTPMSGIPSRAKELENTVINARPDFLTSSGHMGELKLHNKKRTGEGKRQMIKYERAFDIEENCLAVSGQVRPGRRQHRRDRSGNAPNFDQTVEKNRKKAKAAKAARKTGR